MNPAHQRPVADRFEPDCGSHFLAFAVPTITGELRRHFRDPGW
jgi:RNA polymerase sigma-B factor